MGYDRAGRIMRVVSLQSGSNGNCVYVEAGGARLLVDAGISGARAERRLAAVGVDIRDADALLISHDHRDHVRCAGIYQRKFDVPIHITERTLSAARQRVPLGRMHDVRPFRAGAVLRFDGIIVHTVPTPHDGVDGVAFVIEAEGKRLGVLTDLGHPFAALVDLLGSLDAVFLESNYDPGMLADGPYPPVLQDRIRGRGGHLSNVETADLLAEHGRRLQWACLAHLSEENNVPALALETCRTRTGGKLPIHVATRYATSDILEV